MVRARGEFAAHLGLSSDRLKVYLSWAKRCVPYRVLMCAWVLSHFIGLSRLVGRKDF